MTHPVDKPFPSYLETPEQATPLFWWGLRIATVIVMLILVWLIWSQPETGFTIFWKLLIPSLPLVFAAVPGIWRQICPMALVNQIPRTFGFSKEKTLPVKFKNLAYIISVLTFFFLVSLRHVYFNKEPASLIILIFAALSLAFLGGLFFKGRSGWCGTFCPLAPIQKAYGHAPLSVVRNGYCPSCVGCQKNCYDFNPRAAFLSDLVDNDLWYAGHKKFFVAGLPGFAIGFFTVDNPLEIGLFSYYVYLCGWIITTLGIYMAIRIFIRLSDFQIASMSAMSALLIFYWFTSQGIVDTAFKLGGFETPYGAREVFLGLVVFVIARVLWIGRKAEKDFQELNKASAEPKASVNVGAARAGGGSVSDNLVSDLASGRSFESDPSRTLLDGIESAGLVQDFGCRMGMCGADAIAIVDGMENLSPPSEDELATLRRLGLEGRARMACVCKPKGGAVTIDLNMDPNDLPEPPPPADQKDWGEETGINKIVIIGNGTSGLAAADEIRRLSPSCKIDIISRENHHFYNRMAIGRLMYGRTGLEDLYLMTSDWYEKKDINVWLNTLAVSIDRTSKSIQLGTGETLEYDKLIMAQGSRAFVPPADGIDIPGVFVLREAADAQNIRNWRQEKKCMHAVVQGGGVLGIEAADALRKLNLKVTILQRSDRLMNRELDHRGSEILQKFLDNKGIKTLTNSSVQSIEGEDRVTGIKLANGDVLPADIFVVCAGVKANTELADEANLDVNRGVIVNDNMQTSDPDIYAVGDVAELPGEVSGLWAVGTAQASVASSALFGIEAKYKAPSTLVSLKMDGIDVKGFGKFDSTDDCQIIEDAEENAMVHRRLAVQNGKVIGAVFVGPPGVGKDITQIIQKQTEISSITERLKNGDWSALAELSD